MKKRVGNCFNFGNCKNADDKTKIPMDGMTGMCPICGSQLCEVTSSSSFLSKKAISLFLGFTILIGGAWFVLNHFGHEVTTFSDGGCTKST